MTTQLELSELKRPWLDDAVRGFDDIASILGDARPSNRPEANGRLVSVWRVKQKDQ